MVRRQMDEKFDYRDHQLDTSWFVNELGVVLKRIRSELHTMWKKGGSSRDVPTPLGIEIDPWHKLIDYWMSENFLKLSMRMKDNRKKVQIGNLTGRSGKTWLLANLKRKRGSTSPLHEIQEELEIRKYRHQAKARLQSPSETITVQGGGQSEAPVSATDDVKKTSRPDLYNSIVYLQTTQNEMKQKQVTIKKEQMELNKGLLTLNSKMDDLMTILLEKKKQDQPSHVKKMEDVYALKMAVAQDQSRQFRGSITLHSPRGSRSPSIKQGQQKQSRDSVSSRSPRLKPSPSPSTKKDQHIQSRDSASSQSPRYKPSRSPCTKQDQHYKRKNKLFEIGDEMELREVKNAHIILGVGSILGLAGKSNFHSKTIQSGYANILVIKVFAPNAPLVVPNLDDDPPQKVLSDAVRSSVLWPEGSLRRANLVSKGP